jgi:hypothetical protein
MKILVLLILFTWFPLALFAETEARVIKAAASEPLVPPQASEFYEQQNHVEEAKILTVFEMVAHRYRVIRADIRP